jgi:hypothetical protein
VVSPESDVEAETSGEAEAVGRPAPVRGTAPNKPPERDTDGISEAMPAPKSPDHQAQSEVGSRNVRRGGSSRATGACSGHGPEQTTRTRHRRDQLGDAGPEVARPSSTVGSRKPNPRPLTRRQQSGDRRLFGARPRTSHETCDRTGSERRSRPRSRPTINTACSGHGPEQGRGRVRTGSGRRSRPRSRPTIKASGFGFH